MALIASGPVAGRISGNLAGVNFVATTKAAYVRQARRRSGLRSQSQLESRAHLEYIHRQWLDSDEQTRAAWRAAAQHMLFPNRLGVKRPISGFQLAVAYYAALPSDFPTIPFVPPLTYRIPASREITCSFTAGAAYNVSLEHPAPIPLAYHKLYGSRPVRNREMASYKYWRVIGSTPQATGTNDWSTKWDAVFGPLRQGEVVAVRASYIIPPVLEGPTISCAVTVA